MGKEFRKFISYLIYDCNWKWVATIIVILASIEMAIRGMKHKPITDFVGEVIPSGPYCYEHGRTCKYWDYSRVIRTCLGEQCSGHCHFLGENDFTGKTMLLWDQCKECDINDDEEEYFDEI